jgi:hypothetical protein
MVACWLEQWQNSAMTVDFGIRLDGDGMGWDGETRLVPFFRF